MKIYILTETSIKSYQLDGLRVNKNCLFEIYWDNDIKRSYMRDIKVFKDEKSARYVLKRIFNKAKKGEYFIDLNNLML